METILKSKRRKSSPNREFIVDNRESSTEGTAERAAAGRKNKGEANPPRSTFSGVTPEERRQLIAEAAYFRAKQRNFSPGNELEDWLSAEAEIERKLSKGSTERPLRDT